MLPGAPLPLKIIASFLIDVDVVSYSHMMRMFEKTAISITRLRWASLAQLLQPVTTEDNRGYLELHEAYFWIGVPVS